MSTELGRMGVLTVSRRRVKERTVLGLAAVVLRALAPKSPQTKHD
jgi:hypothetical protein